MTIQELLRSLSPLIEQKNPKGEQEPTPLDLSAPAPAHTDTKPKEQKRCGLSDSCKKKLLLSDFACTKCSTRYCGAHRLPEEHACSHDFRREGQILLAKQNPRIVNDKINHI